MNFIYALLYMAVLGSIFLLSYILNKRTPVPAGCEDLKANCEGCKIASCGNYSAPSRQEQEV